MSETANQPRPVDPVQVAESRRRIPVFAVVLFPVLVVWGIIYVNGVTDPPAAANTPEAMGEQLYGSNGCGGCHGVNGEGGSGPAFAGGDLDDVFPDWSEQVKWVDLGSANWTAVTGEDTFGETNKPADPAAGMPGFGPGGNSAMSCEEVALVVAYERTQLAGIEADEEMTEMIEQIAAGDEIDEVPGCVA